ncbi:MAG: ribosome biogenesis GTPase YlqF, partial [Polyangiaceae bacterium]
HMASAMREIEKRARLIDIFIEVIDARVAQSDRNPELSDIIGKKPRLVILTREDLAEPEITKQWIDHYAELYGRAMAVSAEDPNSFAQAPFFMTQLLSGTKTRGAARAMVLGIPNAGKSRVINGLLRRSVAKVENRPGVTRGPQWFRVGPNLEMMDTPGILVTKIESREAQWKLAMCGAIPHDRFPTEEVVQTFVHWVKVHRSRSLPELGTFAQARGMLRAGGELELHTAALAYIKDFNDGKFGRFSFETAPEGNA